MQGRQSVTLVTEVSVSTLTASPVLSSEPELLADYACEIGENPLWHPIERRVYWTDIAAGRLFRYDPATGAHEPCYEGRTVGGFTIQQDGSLLLFMDRGTVAVWRNGSLTEVIPEIPAETASRFNDVIADPRGRVFCGTMSSSDCAGRLYRLDLDGSIHCIMEGVGCSNGMAFTTDHKTFYHTDSYAHEIRVYDYDVETGAIANRRVFARFAESDGLPDGGTLDSEGRFWTALWDGYSVVRLRHDGSVEAKIPFPTKKVSSVTFGGDEYKDLYVTTAGGNKKDENGQPAGSLYRLRTSVRGLPEYFSRIRQPA